MKKIRAEMLQIPVCKITSEESGVRRFRLCDIQQFGYRKQVKDPDNQDAGLESR